MFELRHSDLLQLTGAGGERFAFLIDALIRAEAFYHEVSRSEIRTQLRSNVQDGKVDTEVKSAIPASKSGWFADPTCWQYKAVATKDAGRKPRRSRETKTPQIPARLLKEIRGSSYLSDLLRRGYGYRLCLLGDLPPQSVASWEKALQAEAEKICENARPVKVVHGADIVAWANRYPAIVMSLRAETATLGLHWDAWERTCCAITPHYVPNPRWQPFAARIHRHLDFGQATAEPCVTVYGAAGVGKTRFVLESLRQLGDACPLVIYTLDDNKAREAATYVANLPGARALLVVDESTPQLRFDLNARLRGVIDRVRVVCLDNTGVVQRHDAGLIQLLADDLTENTGAILTANFADTVPADRRSQYARLSRGFVRLAADMCERDAEIAAGDRSILASVEDYVRQRLPPDALQVVSAIALFRRLGFKDEFRDELVQVAKATGISETRFIEVVDAVRQSPGFVAQAGRFWYVTPEVVGRLLFLDGWRKWLSLDIDRFAKALPQHLVQQIAERCGQFGGEEERRQLAAFFRRSFDDLNPQKLSDARVMKFICALVEANPEANLTKLRQLVESTESADWVAQANDSDARRYLVCLLERLVAFCDFFDDCESCLFRLARHETELGIANNATGIWLGLFRVWLSGTAMPFEARLRLLRTRLQGGDDAALAFRALAAAFGASDLRPVGPDWVAGRIVPPEWQPKSGSEERECYRQVLQIVLEFLRGEEPLLRDRAFGVLLHSMSFLLLHGMCDELQTAIQPQELTNDESRDLVAAVDEFLSRETERRDDRTHDYLTKVAAWIAPFRPTDFDGRLRAICSREPWDDSFRESGDGAREMKQLAAEILRAPDRLMPHLNWFAGSKALAAEPFGLELGADAPADKAVVILDLLLNHATTDTGNVALLRGFLRSFASRGHQPNAELLAALNRLEAARPEVVADVLAGAGEAFDGLNRVVRLVALGRIAPRRVVHFALKYGNRRLTPKEAGVLAALFAKSASSSSDEAQAAVRFISYVSRNSSDHNGEEFLADEGRRTLAWQVVEAALPNLTSHQFHEWCRIVQRLAAHDIDRAARLLGRVLLHDDLAIARRAKSELGQLIATAPREVMQALGAALLDPTRGKRLQVDRLTDLVASLPEDEVFGWITHAGLEGARVISRHLPASYVDATGEAVVPSLWLRILDAFPDEDVARGLSHRVTGAWNGNGAEQFRERAAEARRFLGHSNRWVRDWARKEIVRLEELAECEEQWHEEALLPT